MLLLCAACSQGVDQEGSERPGEEEVDEILRLSVTEPWMVSQARIEALRPVLDQLAPSQRRELALVEARNLALAGRSAQSLTFLEQLLTESMAPEMTLRAHVLASNAAAMEENYEAAFVHIQDGLDLLDEVDYPKARADVLGRASYLFTLVEEFERSLIFARRAVAAARQTGDQREICAELVQYANAQYRHPAIDLVVLDDTLDEAQGYCEAAADPVFLAIIESMRGQFLLESGDYQQATVQLEKALEAMRAVDYATGNDEARFYLIKAYFHAGDLQAALDMGQGLPEALSERSRWRQLAEVREVFARIAERRGDYARALDEQDKALEARDRQYSDDRALEVAYHQVIFERRLQAFDRQVLERQAQREQWFRNSAIGGSGLLLLVGFMTLRRYRTRLRLNRQIERKNRELSALGEIARDINARATAEAVLATLLRGSVRILSEVSQGEVMVRDWRFRQFRWANVYAEDSLSVLPGPLSAERVLDEYVSQSTELVRGIYRRPGPPLRSIPDAGRESDGDDRTLLILTLPIDGEIEGLLVLVLPDDSLAAQAPDTDRLSRLRSHAIAALTRARQLEALTRERVRADEALADLKQTHDELQAAMQEVRRASDNKGRFLAQVSHELRTPLHAISGYSQKLLRDLSEALGSKPGHFTQQLHNASNHLLALIDDLMDISRMEAGRTPVSLSPVELPALVEEVAGIISPQMRKTGNRLAIEYGEIPGTVHADAVKLRQILLNLLSNAARFTDNGQVRLHTGQWVDDQGIAWLRIQVSDNGVGIAPEDRERVFEAFSQPNQDVDRRSQGTGLGLAVTRNLCELLGGGIELESTPGRGSSFVIHLPWRDEAGAARGEDALLSSNAASGQGRVFIVEDNRVNRELMEEYLRLEGFEVLSAETGEAALEKIPLMRPDVVLMDMHLPGIQGDEVTRRLKARKDGIESVPVIAVSAFTGDDVRRRALEAGCSEYQTKPVDFNQLVGRIREITA